MVKGKLGSGRLRKERQPNSGVRKHIGQSSVTGSGPKPMDIDDKMSFSLEDIIKRERDSKRLPKKERKNVSRSAPQKKIQESRRKMDIKSKVRQPKEAPNLQITVNAGKIRDRPVLNQIISNAEFSESQMASRGVAPGLRERVQPVSLDYRFRHNDRHHESSDYSSYPSNVRSHPVLNKTDHNMYYNNGQRTEGDIKMRRY